MHSMERKNRWEISKISRTKLLFLRLNDKVSAIKSSFFCWTNLIWEKKPKFSVGLETIWCYMMELNFSVLVISHENIFQTQRKPENDAFNGIYKDFHLKKTWYETLLLKTRISLHWTHIIVASTFFPLTREGFITSHTHTLSFFFCSRWSLI